MEVEFTISFHFPFISPSIVAASPLGQRQLLLTKGDNNHIDDIELYRGLQWLERRHIVGKVRGCVDVMDFTAGHLLPFVITGSSHTSAM